MFSCIVSCCFVWVFRKFKALLEDLFIPEGPLDMSLFHFALPLDFYWEKLQTDRNHSLERSGIQWYKSYVMCSPMEYIHFSFSHSFMIVNCPAITISKNISCLSYIYLFEYWFSCVIETLRNPSTFFKSDLGTSLFKYYWLFLKVTSLLKIGFRCVMTQKEIENIFILETINSPTLTHICIICYQSLLLLIFKRMLQRTERSCVQD